MQGPLVTVLMSVYNGGKYLRPSVESILNQTYKDFEFFIVNDQSTDDSVKIIESFHDKRIVIHHNEMNLGLTKSLNVGLKLARGKYVARMDADDIAFEMWLEKLMHYFRKHPEHAAVGSSAVVIDGAGKKKEIRRAPINLHEIIFRVFFAPPMNHVSVLLNKELILENGGYDEKFRITQDYELWSSLIRNRYTITNLPDILVSYRVHSHSVGFIEANKRGFQEKTETMFRNIQSLTNLEITKSDVEEICKLFYHTPELNPEMFHRAQSNFENIYPHLKEGFMLPTEFFKKGIKTQMLKPYCKLAVHKVQNNEIREARKIAMQYCRQYGFHMMPFLIFLTTFGGYRISKRIPYVYEKGLETVTKLFPRLKSS